MYKRSYNINFIRIWPEKPGFFRGWSWLKFNNLGLALGANLTFYASLSKGLKLKVRKFWGAILTFAEVTGEKLVGGGGLFGPPSWIGLKAREIKKKIWDMRSLDNQNLYLIYKFMTRWRIKRIKSFSIEIIYATFKWKLWIYYCIHSEYINLHMVHNTYFQKLKTND